MTRSINTSLLDASCCCTAACRLLISSRAETYFDSAACSLWNNGCSKYDNYVVRWRTKSMQCTHVLTAMRHEFPSEHCPLYSVRTPQTSVQYMHVYVSRSTFLRDEISSSFPDINRTISLPSCSRFNFSLQRKQYVRSCQQI